MDCIFTSAAADDIGHDINRTSLQREAKCILNIHLCKPQKKPRTYIFYFVSGKHNLELISEIIGGPHRH